MKLLLPRLLALQRGREEAGWRRIATVFTLAAMFWIGAYAITVRVLHHFATVDPDLGRILAAKLLALLFLMLVTFLAFSALITAISQCFLARDLPLLIAAPVPLRRLFRVKLLEVSLFSSWTAVFLAFPVFVAYGTVFEAGIDYYAALVMILVPCAAMAGAFGILVGVALVNLFPARRARDLLSLVALVFLVGIVFLLRVMRPERFVRPESFGTWADYLVSLSNPTLPWLPSYWAARVLGEVLGIYQATHWAAVAWYGGLLLVVTLVTMGLSAGVFREGFRTGWSRSQEARHARWTRKPWWNAFLGLIGAPFPRRQRAIIRKDATTIFRDPGQWSQLLLLLAVVVIYLYNIRVLPLDAAGGTGYFLRNLLAFLNVGLVGLVVTALAARFVLPGVSLEGNTLWLLRASPLPVRELLWSKFWGGFVPLVVVAELLVVFTNTILHTTPLLHVLSIAAVLCITAAIAGMGVGLGAAHPRFDAADGTQVAAGYAGFLFMVLSALLVLLSVTVLAWPVYHSFRATWLGAGVGAREWGGLAAGLVVVGGISGIALYSAMRTGCERMAISEES